MPAKNILFSVSAYGSSGELKIRRSFFPSKGFYKGRLKALGKHGEQVGLCGDHFPISIDF